MFFYLGTRKAEDNLETHRQRSGTFVWKVVDGVLREDHVRYCLVFVKESENQIIIVKISPCNKILDSVLDKIGF